VAPPPLRSALLALVSWLACVPLAVAQSDGLPAGGHGASGSQGTTSGRHGKLSGKHKGDQPPPEPGEEPLASGVIKVRAESYEQTSKGHVEARGLVDLRLADVRIQADKADVIEDAQPDGSTKRRIVADGNVVFIRGEERLSGDHLEMDDAGRGTLLNAVGYIEPGVYVQAQRIERLDEDSYRVYGGTFTSCSQPTPRWGFSASRAKIDVDDKIIGTNAVFRVEGVPAFYTPFIYYPISRNQRSTGFLLPSVGYNSARGYTLNTGFFWAMGRSADQTLSLDYFSKAGYGLSHDLRWLSDSPSRGRLHSIFYDLQGTSKKDYDLDWNILQELPGKVRATGNLRLFSNMLFLQQYSENFAQASARTERWSASLERDFGIGVLTAYGDSTNTFFGTDTHQVSGRAPGISLRRFPRQVGFGGLVFGLEGSAEKITYGTQNKTDSWTRYDIGPTLSRPLHVSFLDINPSVGYRYSHYGTTVVVDEKGNPTYDDNGEPVRTGPPLDRSFFETSLDIRGPTFARVFDTPGFGYSDRFKHTIGPEITWTYRTRVDDYGAIPKSDGQDFYLGTDQINYALAQRFYAKRGGTSGKPMPYEFFSWRLMQTYYVQIKQGQNNFDPNYSSSAYGPGGALEHLSPLQSRMKLRPLPDFSLDYQLEYDVNFKQIRRQSAFASVMRPGFTLQASWSRSMRVTDKPEKKGVSGEMLRGSTVFDVLPERLTIEGSAEYDLVSKTLWQMRGQIRYGVQCCGFKVEVVRFDWTNRVDTQWRFAIELANVGSIGSSMGADLTGGRGTGGMGGF
jgi:LPS-assembly protein